MDFQDGHSEDNSSRNFLASFKNKIKFKSHGIQICSALLQVRNPNSNPISLVDSNRYFDLHVLTTTAEVFVVDLFEAREPAVIEPNHTFSHKTNRILDLEGSGSPITENFTFPQSSEEFQFSGKDLIFGLFVFRERANPDKVMVFKTYFTFLFSNIFYFSFTFVFWSFLFKYFDC